MDKQKDFGDVTGFGGFRLGKALCAGERMTGDDTTSLPRTGRGKNVKLVQVSFSLHWFVDLFIVVFGLERLQG